MVGGSKLHGGEDLKAEVTAGGHVATSTQQPAFPDFHRKLADPTPFAWLAFGATLLLYGLFVIGVQGVVTPNEIVAPAMGLGGFLLIIATIFEYIAGRTFPATMFGVYGAFFLGSVVLRVPWFGLTGVLQAGAPNTYAAGGPGAAELPDVIGLWLSTFIILTAFLLIAATRQSVAVLSFLLLLELFFVCHMAQTFRNDGQGSPLAKASAGFAIASGLIGWYLSLSALCTPDSAWFTLPVIPLDKEE